MTRASNRASIWNRNGEADHGDGGRRRPGGLVALLAAVLLALACGEPSPEAQLEEARERLERGRQEVASAEARLQEVERRLEKVRKDRSEAREALEEARAQVEEARTAMGRFATDDAIFRTVQKSLLDDEELGDVAIPVRVNDGVVSLMGEVPEAALAERAEKLAAEVPGVVEVRNSIAVREGEGSGGSSSRSGGSRGAESERESERSGEAAAQED